jgi:hypothetical protein
VEGLRRGVWRCEKRWLMEVRRKCESGECEVSFVEVSEKM